MRIIILLWYVQIGETPFYIAVDHAQKTVVISIRGTLSVQVCKCKIYVITSHMKCGTYMFLIALKLLPPPLQDPIFFQDLAPSMLQRCQSYYGWSRSAVQNFGSIAQDSTKWQPFSMGKKSHVCTFSGQLSPKMA